MARVGDRLTVRTSVGGSGRRAVAIAATTMIACWGSACAWSQQRSAEEPVDATELAGLQVASTAAPSESPSNEQEPAPGTLSPYTTPVELSEQVAFAIQQVEGTSAAAAGAMLAPAADPVGRCTPKEPGALQVKVTRSGERTDLDVVPGSSVDADTRRCVLAALAMLDADDMPARSGTPSAEPRSFSSTVSISW